MTSPVSQHYVPQMLLRRFTDSTGTLYFACKEWESDKVLPSSPAKLFKQRHLYTTSDETGQKDFTLEFAYGELEEQTGPILDKLIAAVELGQLPQLQKRERQILNLFIYQQWRRVPEMHSAVFNVGSVDEAIRTIEEALESKGKTLSDEERRSLQAPGKVEQIIQSGKVQSLLEVGGRVLKTFESMSLGYLVINNSNKSFVIGSHPVLKLADAKNPKLDNSSTEIWLPISSKVALCLGHHKEEIVAVPQEKDVRKLNLTTSSQSSIIAGPSEFLIRSLRNPR